MATEGWNQDWRYTNFYQANSEYFVLCVMSGGNTTMREGCGFKLCCFCFVGCVVLSFDVEMNCCDVENVRWVIKSKNSVVYNTWGLVTRNVTEELK